MNNQNTIQHINYSSYGTVTLVGFGPGDPDLLTIKALKALQKADTIIHDDLIDKEFLSQFGAEKIYVGKRSGRHSSEQDEINDILLEKAYSGKQVVRLKGGDPMIFAHAGEEIEYLQKHKIEVSVIPGITTASALAADMKVSLTQRKISSSVAFINGHSHFLEIPNADTLVFYMGASNLKNIAKKILSKGWAYNTPVLLVHNVSLPTEESFELTLGELYETSNSFPTPLIALVGDVAGLRKQEASTIKRTLYTGTLCDNRSYIHTPLIETEELNDYSHTKELLAQHNNYILFDSIESVKHTLNIIRKEAIDTSNIKFVSTNSATTKLLKQEELNNIFHVDNAIEWFKDQPLGNILIPTDDTTNKHPFFALEKQGFNVKLATVSSTTKIAYPQKVNLDTIQSVVFTSSAAIDNFINIYGSLPESIEYITLGICTQSYLESISR